VSAGGVTNNRTVANVRFYLNRAGGLEPVAWSNSSEDEARPNAVVERDLLRWVSVSGIGLGPFNLKTVSAKGFWLYFQFAVVCHHATERAHNYFWTPMLVLATDAYYYNITPCARTFHRRIYSATLRVFSGHWGWGLHHVIAM
jgi:hypothetical protein